MRSTTEANPVLRSAHVVVRGLLRTSRNANASARKDDHYIINSIRMQKGGSVYILTNNHNTTLYIGVTSDLPGRIMQHREKVYRNSFTERYNLFKLVFFEVFHSIEEAIAREKQLKAGSRRKKEAMIAAFNPEWVDLFDEVKYW